MGGKVCDHSILYEVKPFYYILGLSQEISQVLYRWISHIENHHKNVQLTMKYKYTNTFIIIQLMPFPYETADGKIDHPVKFTNSTQTHCMVKRTQAGLLSA